MKPSMKTVMAASKWLSKYRAWRYVLYVVIFFAWIPLRYTLNLALGLIAVILEEIGEATKALINEYRTLVYILRQERKNAKHDS